jgi:hypothetical protein
MDQLRRLVGTDGDDLRQVQLEVRRVRERASDGAGDERVHDDLATRRLSARSARRYGVCGGPRNHRGRSE